MSKPTTKRKPPAGKAERGAPSVSAKAKAAPAAKKAKAAPPEAKTKAAPAAKKTKAAPAEAKTKAAPAVKKAKAAPAEAKAKAAPAAKKAKAAPAARKTRAKAAPRAADADSGLSLAAMVSETTTAGVVSEPSPAPSGSVDAEGADAEAPGSDGLRAALQIVADEAPVESSTAARAAAGGSASVDVGELDGDEAHLYLKGLIEAILFVAEAPLSVKELARAAKIDRKRAQELLDELRAGYDKRGIQIQEVAGGFCFRSNADYAEYVRGHLAQRPVRLSRPQLETLAIIAYRQPITRPEIDDIRGVDSGPVLKGLLERDLVKILGKKDEPGRPMLYGTSAGFLDLFSMQSLQDLPTLKEFTELSEESRRRFEQQLGEDAPDGPVDLSRLEATISPSTDPSEFDDPEVAPADDAGAEIDPEALGPQEVDVTSNEQDEPENELEEGDQLSGAKDDEDDDGDDDDGDDDEGDEDDDEGDEDDDEGDEEDDEDEDD